LQPNPELAIEIDIFSVRGNDTVSRCLFVCLFVCLCVCSSSSYSLCTAFFSHCTDDRFWNLCRSKGKPVGHRIGRDGRIERRIAASVTSTSANGSH
jgi:hypothetical protein